MLKELKNIAARMEAIGDSIRREGAVCRAELNERLRLGLTGDAAIEHYNAWMIKSGMPHLVEN